MSIWSRIEMVPAPNLEEAVTDSPLPRRMNPRRDKLLADRIMSRIESEEPIFKKSRTLQRSAKRAKLRRLKLLPRVKQSRIDMLSPTALTPAKMESDELRRAVDRMESVLPICRKSSMDNPLSADWYNRPNIDTADPTLQKDLSESELPAWRKSRIDAVWPIRVAVRSEMDDPRAHESRTDSDFCVRIIAALADNVVPNFSAMRTLSAEPRVIKSSKDAMLPQVPVERKLRLEPMNCESSTESGASCPRRAARNTDSVDPSRANALIDVQLPNFAYDRIERLDPSADISRTETCDVCGMRTCELTDIFLPTCSMLRIDMLEPKCA
jgi:hypothetical protein